MNILARLHETYSLPAVLACIGALLSAGGAIWASYEQNKAQTKAESQTVEIKQLNTKILSLSEENKILAKEGISAVTGGNGFAYIDILKGYFPNAFTPAVISASEYPQYDLEIRFYDPHKDHNFQVYVQPLMLNIATLPPGHTRLHDKIPAFDLDGKTDYAQFNIFISARNGTFFEELHLRKVDGEWYSALRLFKSESNSKDILLLERAMDKYPRSNDQSLIW